jgi:hypothetical protein
LGRGGGSASGWAAHLSVSSTHLVDCSTARASDRSAEISRLEVHDVLAGFGVDKVLAELCGALGGGKVGDEHVRKSRQGLGCACSRSLTATASDLDRRAVHVELTVTDLVVPGPGKSVTTCGDIRGHGDRELVRDWRIGGCDLRILREVDVGQRGRASSNDTLDNLPLGVLIGLRVSGDGKLARTTTVDCSAHERDVLGLPGVPCVHCVDGVDTLALLARKVGGFERRSVKSVFSERDWVVHENMSGSTGGKRRDGNDFGEHVEV